MLAPVWECVSGYTVDAPITEFHCNVMVAYHRRLACALRQCSKDIITGGVGSRAMVGIDKCHRWRRRAAVSAMLKNSAAIKAPMAAMSKWGLEACGCRHLYGRRCDDIPAASSGPWPAAGVSKYKLSTKPRSNIVRQYLAQSVQCA